MKKQDALDIIRSAVSSMDVTNYLNNTLDDVFDRVEVSDDAEFDFDDGEDFIEWLAEQMVDE